VRAHCGLGRRDEDLVVPFDLAARCCARRDHRAGPGFDWKQV